MSIASYLSALVVQKNILADNLVSMGVSASTSETLNTLVPKVLDISGGGGSGKENEILDRTISVYENNTATGSGARQGHRGGHDDGSKHNRRMA